MVLPECDEVDESGQSLVSSALSDSVKKEGFQIGSDGSTGTVAVCLEGIGTEPAPGLLRPSSGCDSVDAACPAAASWSSPSETEQQGHFTMGVGENV